MTCASRPRGVVCQPSSAPCAASSSVVPKRDSISRSNPLSFVYHFDEQASGELPGGPNQNVSTSSGPMVVPSKRLSRSVIRRRPLSGLAQEIVERSIELVVGADRGLAHALLRLRLREA